MQQRQIVAHQRHHRPADGRGIGGGRNHDRHRKQKHGTSRRGRRDLHRHGRIRRHRRAGSETARTDAQGRRPDGRGRHRPRGRRTQCRTGVDRTLRRAEHSRSARAQQGRPAERRSRRSLGIACGDRYQSDSGECPDRQGYRGTHRGDSRSRTGRDGRGLHHGQSRRAATW